MPRGVPANRPQTFTVVLNLRAGQGARQITFQGVVTENPLAWAREIAKSLNLALRSRGGTVLFRENPKPRPDGGYNVTLHISGKDVEP